MLYCGKFFYTKKHKLPDLNEINSDFNDQNSNQYQSTRFNNKDNYQFSSTKLNETRRNYNNNNANDTDYYPKSSINKNINDPISTNNGLQSKIKKTEKDQDQKKNVLTLHINYNEGNDSFNSKSKNSQYYYQPPDSFFHNKLEKQPPSMIKSHHHHKKKKVPENWPEIPQDILNHRIDYQYSSPTKVPLEEEIKKLHKKKNNQRKQNRFSSPENSKGKIENSFGSTVEAQIEEEEEEFESDKMRNLNTSSKKTISDGSFSKTKKEDKNKLITDLQIEEEEEEYGNNNLENVANKNKYSSDKNSESYNTTNYSRYSNSYKSVSSIPNEEEEFEVNKKSNYTKHKSTTLLKGNTNSIATSPFYKPNLQFQQFNYNEEINELSQSQTIKPPQNGQPQNLSRSNRIKAKSNSKKQVAMTNKNSDSFHISKEEISLRPAKQSPNSFKDVSQDKSRSPKNYDEQAESPKSLKKKSPNLSSKSLSSSQSNSKSPPISNDQNKFKTNYNYYDNKLSPQISNDQIIANDYDSMKDCFKYDSHEKTLSSQVINEISNLKSIRNKQKSSSNDTLSPQNNQRTSQIPAEQISPNSMNNKTPISSNSKESYSRSSKKKSRTSNSLKDYSSSSQSSSKSSQFANEQENISPPKKISPNSNSIKSNRSSKNNSRSPKDLNESKKSTSPKNKSHDTNIISSPQSAIEDQNEEEVEPIFFERLQLSEKEISNSDKYENSEPQPLNLPNGHFSSESYNIEENKENLSEVQEPHISDNELLEPNENDDHVSIEIDQLENVNSINVDIAIEEEEEEHEMSQTNEEESLVMLSELQKTNDLSPLPKKKSSNYPVSINQLSSDETEVNDSATEIHESFLHVPKAASKEQKSIILDEEDETEEEKLNDDELSQSSKTFSSILTSKKPEKNNEDHLRHSNLVSSIEEVNDIEPITLDDPLIDNINVDEEEEEEVELLDESNEVTPNSLSTIHDNSDEMITTIQDVIFEEDFNIIPTDSNLLASDDPEEISLDHIPNKASNQANKAIKKQLNVDDDNDDEKKKAGTDISDSLFSDSNKADMMLGESIQDDVHSSEIRFLIESTDQNRDETENEEEEVSNSFEGIQSLSMKSIKEAHLVDLGDDDHEIFDFNDEFEEESNNSNRDVYEHSSFDKELKKVNDNQYSILETTMLQSGTSNTNNLELIYNSIKFNHPSIRFGLRSIVSFSDRLLRKQLNNVI